MGKPAGAKENASKAVYSLAARRLHWWTVALLAVQIPVGLFMVRYGPATDFAPPTGALYDGHKILGLAILLLVAARLGHRLANGALPPEASLARWQRGASAFTHWAIYAMLFLTPLIGWLAISYYGPFRPFGLALPRLAAANSQRATLFFTFHRLAAYLLIVLIAIHVAAALAHYFIHKDGVMARMLARAGRRA